VTRKHSFLEHDGLLAFAHRGDQENAPENTMPAFQSAAQLGFKYIETDVQATADGILVIFHDRMLDRLTGVKGRIDQITWPELRLLKINGIVSIPTLEEVLGDFSNIRFNIEPKSDKSVDLLAQVIRRTASIERICVGSFSDKRLKRIRSIFPDICTSMGRFEVARARLHSKGISKPFFTANCVQVPVRWKGIQILDHQFISAMKQQGLQVHVWTVNDSKEMDRLIDLGVDGLMTDYPLILRDVLKRRSLWPQAN